MRIGILAAAAAALMCSAQADAARYYEFELKGIANTPLIYVASGVQRQFTYTDTIRFVFDTLAGSATPEFPYYFANGDTYSIVLSANPGVGMGSLTTLTMPDGPLFGFSFKFADVGETLSAIGTSNTGFGYRIRPDGRYSTTYDTLNGQIFSFKARTTDVSPGFVGAIQSLSVTLLPEPATWALMILGVAAAGASFRRDRRGRRPAMTVSHQAG